VNFGGTSLAGAKRRLCETAIRLESGAKRRCQARALNVADDHFLMSATTRVMLGPTRCRALRAMIWRLRYLVLSSERKTEAVGNSRCARVLHSIETASPSAGRQRDLLRRSLLTQHRLISAMADLNPPLFLGVLLLTACTAATSPSPYRVTELVPPPSTPLGISHALR
jgi:hypothetical protein